MKEEIFDIWNELKKEINKKNMDHVYFNQGEIWWISLGKNIKSESFGKGESFRRPVLIFKKLSSDTFIGIPLSSQKKIGTWFETYTLQEEENTALLYQIRMLHKNRLGTKIGQIDEMDFEKIKKSLANLLELS